MAQKYQSVEIVRNNVDATLKIARESVARY